MLASFYKPLIGGVRRLHQLPSTIVHQQKKRDMLCEWSTMGVSEQFLRAFKKEYIGTWRCVATLPAGYPTTNNAQEGMNCGLKRVWMRHKRRGLLPFLEWVRRMLRNWSHDRWEAVPGLYRSKAQLTRIAAARDEHMVYRGGCGGQKCLQMVCRVASPNKRLPRCSKHCKCSR